MNEYAESDASIVEWGVRSDAGGSGTATYGPYTSRSAAEEVRDRLIEGGGWLISRRVTSWVDAPHLCDRCRDGEHWRCSEPGICECTEPVDTPPTTPGS